MNRHEKNPDKKISPKTKHRQLGPTNYAFQQTPLGDFSLDMDGQKNEPMDDSRIQEISDEKSRDDIEVKTELTENPEAKRDGHEVNREGDNLDEPRRELET